MNRDVSIRDPEFMWLSTKQIHGTREKCTYYVEIGIVNKQNGNTTNEQQVGKLADLGKTRRIHLRDNASNFLTLQFKNEHTDLYNTKQYLCPYICNTHSYVNGK